MGASISSGSVKYVFTQATSPSGEGEVVGSLWYDTSTKILYTYDGSSWNKVATSDSWKIIDKGTITGASANISISAIASGYSILKLIICGNPVSDGPYEIVFNSDTGASSYAWSRHNASMASTSVWDTDEDGADDSLQFYDLENTKSCAIEVTMGNIATEPKPVTSTCLVANDGSHLNAGIWLNPSDEISSIDVSCTNNFDIGTTWVLLGIEGV